jgi:UDP-N-acetylglucosamine 2-epimerase (non-hydrolysing)/GDP/UDP-N,N'-diacetylbacillosamine 2-epimerase (hydrolysing)
VRTIGVVSTSRADYSYYLPLLRAITEDPELRLHLLVSGMHLVPEFGLTVKAIEADGFPIAARIETLVASDTPEAIGKSMGLAVIGFAQAFAAFRPDVLVVLGDRFEMHAAGLAALPYKLPVAHIGGGDVTEGAIDESLRHSLTKLSHLHFVAGAEQQARILQMGEEPWRVFVTGELSLDVIHTTPRLSAEEMAARFGVQLDRPFLLATYHPVTLEYEKTGEQIAQFLAALDEIGMLVLFTAPNADTAGRLIATAIQEYVADHTGSRLVESLGAEGFYTCMSMASAMVGNSSSGLIEATSFELPVVNVGNRQHGRVRARNIIDCGDTQPQIVAALKQALKPEFRTSLRGLKNPYGTGTAAAQIVHQLKNISIDEKLICKRFVDYDCNLEQRGRT